MVRSNRTLALRMIFFANPKGTETIL
jgi:hypothetical protein